MENSSDKYIHANREDKKYSENSHEIIHPDRSLLWTLCLKRRDAFEEMNCNLDEIVKRCFTAKRHLEAIEDSNRNLKKEVNSLRSKYAAMLEKNRKDTGIIMRLKDSESKLEDVLQSHKKTGDSFIQMRRISEEKIHERSLLGIDRDKLAFKSKTVSNTLRKLNLKHKRIYELIEDENTSRKEDEIRSLEEVQMLESILIKNDSFLEEWLKYTAERDSTILSLQEDIKNGLMIYLQDDQGDVKSEETSKSDTSLVETETAESTENSPSPEENDETNVTESETSEKDATVKKTESLIAAEKTTAKKAALERAALRKAELQKETEITFRREWLKKKTLYEVAERQKEHWIDFYMILNNRMQDLNTEIVNVREWLIDKQAERNELLKRTAEMEKLVSQKRRRKPVPPRTSTVEMEIWIKVLRETNNTLRKIPYKCLPIRLEDLQIYSEFAKTVKDMYLDSLKKQYSPEVEMGTSLEEQTVEGEKEA